MGFDDIAWKLFELPLRWYFKRVDERRGKLYVLPPYTDDIYLRHMSMLAALAIGIVIFLVLVLVYSRIDGGCLVILVLIVIGCVTMVLRAPYGKYPLVIFQDRVEISGRKYFHMNFVHLDIYPEIAVRRKTTDRGVDFDPFYNFVFTLDIGHRDIEEQVSVFCKEREVPGHISDLRSYLPTLRVDFHRDHTPDDDFGILSVYKTFKDLKKFKLK